MVCHSEGTATALRALDIAGWPAIDEMHLLCGACDSNFIKNGLHRAILENRIRKVFVYFADRDAAMKLEDTYLGSLCFGLQTAGTPLGLKGPVNNFYWNGYVQVNHWPHYGHSTCWDSKHFEKTMQQIVNHCAPESPSGLSTLKHHLSTD
jgi:hypothetical protein